MEIVYKEPYEVDTDIIHMVCRELWESGPMKPWTLRSRTDVSKRDLKELLLDWYIDVDADGDVILGRH